jgi:hypothetical protein
VFEVLQEPDLDWLLIDSTLDHFRSKVLSTAAGKKRYRQADEALGRSRGGYSSKIHVSVDALGNPRRVMLWGGQVDDLKMAAGLIEIEHTGGCGS